MSLNMNLRKYISLLVVLAATLSFAALAGPTSAQAVGSCPKIKESKRFQVYADVRRASCGSFRILYHYFVHHTAPHLAGDGFKQPGYGAWGSSFKVKTYTCRFKTLDWWATYALHNNSVYNLRCVRGPARRKQVVGIRRRQDGKWAHTSFTFTGVNYSTIYNDYSGLPSGKGVVHLNVCGPGDRFWVNWQWNKKPSVGSGSIQRRQSGSGGPFYKYSNCNDYTFTLTFGGAWSGGAHAYCFRAKAADALWSGIRCTSRQVRYYAPY